MTGRARAGPRRARARAVRRGPGLRLPVPGASLAVTGGYQARGPGRRQLDRASLVIHGPRAGRSMGSLSATDPCQ